MTQFAPETYPHNLWWYSQRFQSVQLKNVSAECGRLFQARVPQQLAKLKIWPGRLDFAPETCRHSFGVQFLSFLVSTVKNCFSRVLMTFQVRAPLEEEKLKTGPIWLDLLAETYLHFFGVQFLSFHMSTAKQCFGSILMTFPGLGTTRAGPQKAKLIIGPEWPGFAPETYPHCLGCSSYRLSSLLLKTVLVEFWRLFRARALLEQLKRKIGPGWLSFTPETYPHNLWCSSYRFQSVQLKHVSAEFWRVFKPM